MCRLRLFQLYAVISQNEAPQKHGLTPGSQLVTSLKQRVVTLASNVGVLATVQAAAQSVLHNGWSLLLPTADERAKALSSLLPSAGKSRRRPCLVTSACVRLCSLRKPRHSPHFSRLSHEGAQALYHWHISKLRTRKRCLHFSLVLVSCEDTQALYHWPLSVSVS